LRGRDLEKRRDCESMRNGGIARGKLKDIIN